MQDAHLSWSVLSSCPVQLTVHWFIQKGTMHPGFCWFNACLLFLMSLFPFCHSQTCTDASGPHAWFLFPSTWLRPHQPSLGLLASPTSPGPPIMMFTLSLLLQTYLHQTLWRETLLIPVSCLTHSCAGGAVHGQNHDSHSCFTAVHVPGQLNFFYKWTASCPHATNASNMYSPSRPLSLPASIFPLFQGFRNLFLNFFISSSPTPHCPFSHCLHRSFIINFTTPSFIHHCVLELWMRSPNVETLHKHFPSVKDNQKSCWLWLWRYIYGCEWEIKR